MKTTDIGFEKFPEDFHADIKTAFIKTDEQGVCTMTDNIREKLEQWVKKSYKQYATGWTYERSEGNYCDCFEDGFTCGESWAAYEIGCILEMDLEEPELDERDFI